MISLELKYIKTCWNSSGRVKMLRNSREQLCPSKGQIMVESGFNVPKLYPTLETHYISPVGPLMLRVFKRSIHPSHCGYDAHTQKSA